MQLSECIQQYQSNYDVVDIVDLDQWYQIDPAQRRFWLESQIKQLILA